MSALELKHNTATKNTFNGTKGLYLMNTECVPTMPDVN